MEMPKYQCFWQRREIAKELKPESTKDQDHGTRAAGHGVVEEPGSVCGTVSDGDSTIRNFRLVAMALFRDVCR
jgi:hypothetical protein